MNMQIRKILALLLALLTLLLAACAAPQPPKTEPAATPVAPTVAPTIASTVAPTPTPTAIPTPTLAPSTAPVTASGYFDHSIQRSDLHFSEMKYVEFDLEAYEAKIAEFTSLLESEGNAEAVKLSFDALYSDCAYADAMSCLASVLYNLDYQNDALLNDSDVALEIAIAAKDAFQTVAAAAINSPLYGDALASYLGEKAAESYRDYKPMTDELKALYNEEKQLENEYDRLAAEEIKGRVDGKEMTLDDVYDMYSELSEAEFENMTQQVYKTANEKQGGLLIRMRDVRNRIAELEGYDNYVEYCYDSIYGRDYEPEAALAFGEAVKECLAKLPELYSKMAQCYVRSSNARTAKTPDEVLELVHRYAAKLDPELEESYDYMVEHGLVDITDDEKKLQGIGYTTFFNYYGVPFVYNAPDMSMFDIGSMTHEFGHYNNYYYCQPSNRLVCSSSYDVCEIHSQGLEVLFSQFYDEIYPKNADCARLVLVYMLCSNIIEGCKFDQLQQEFYLNDLSLEEMNKRFMEICEEHGKAYPEGCEFDRTWIYVPHTFTSPMYYISYATSALSSLQIFNMTMEDPERALVEYMKLTAYGDADVGYIEVLEKAGFGVFTDIDYVKSVLNTVFDYMEKVEVPA